ncbi:MAG: sulfurtransferase [Acidiferrobacterales bacterium]
MRSCLPLIVEPAELEAQLGAIDLLIVDLCRPELYRQGHIRGAVHLHYTQLVAVRPPVMGLVPSDEQLIKVLGALGLTTDTFVVAYDDEGGGCAARLLWTLEVVGHPHYALLDGGLHAWAAEQRPLSADAVTPNPSDYLVTVQGGPVANKEYILEHLSDPKVVLVDTRSPAEYSGVNQRAQRAGHIPGAVNFDWVNAMDRSRGLRLRPQAELREELVSMGITPDKEIITYCHTHHRSAHTYMVLKSLDYPNIKSYPGSWSEWGNSADTPVE